MELDTFDTYIKPSRIRGKKVKAIVKSTKIKAVKGFNRKAEKKQWIKEVA